MAWGSKKEEPKRYESSRSKPAKGYDFGDIEAGALGLNLGKSRKQVQQEEEAKRPQLNVCYRFVKRILLGLNFLFVCFGIVLIAVGIYANRQDIGNMSIQNNLPAGLIAIGVFVFIMAVVGCCGAWKENRCVLTVYTVILVVLIICQLIIASLILAKRGADNESVVTSAWNVASNSQRSQVQDAFRCCGLLNNATAVLPCDVASRPPCLDAMKNEIDSLFTVAGVVGVTLACVQIFGLILSVLLMRGIKFSFDEFAQKQASGGSTAGKGKGGRV